MCMAHWEKRIGVRLTFLGERAGGNSPLARCPGHIVRLRISPGSVLGCWQFHKLCSKTGKGGRPWRSGLFLPSHRFGIGQRFLGRFRVLLRRSSFSSESMA